MLRSDYTLAGKLPAKKKIPSLLSLLYSQSRTGSDKTFPAVLQSSVKFCTGVETCEVNIPVSQQYPH